MLEKMTASAQTDLTTRVVTNLRNLRLFYQAYAQRKPAIRQTPSDELPGPGATTAVAVLKLQTQSSPRYRHRGLHRARQFIRRCLMNSPRPPFIWKLIPL